MNKRHHKYQESRQISRKAKAELGLKKIISSFEPATEQCLIYHLKVDPNKTSLICLAGQKGINQRDNSGGAEKILSTDSKICGQ